jgi:hypothetical protein
LSYQRIIEHQPIRIADIGDVHNTKREHSLACEIEETDDRMLVVCPGFTLNCFVAAERRDPPGSGFPFNAGLRLMPPAFFQVHTQCPHSLKGNISSPYLVSQSLGDLPDHINRTFKPRTVEFYDHAVDADGDPGEQALDGLRRIEVNLSSQELCSLSQQPQVDSGWHYPCMTTARGSYQRLVVEALAELSLQRLLACR